MVGVFDPGYCREPFESLCAAVPGKDVYPAASFRVEWGPVFHRGRLDGSARLLIIGQDPAQHEAVVRRILVGEAGHRLQGFMAKLGVDRSYVLVNTFLYGAYGTLDRASVKNPAIAAYRNRWLDALLPGNVEVVVALGDAADAAWKLWRANNLATSQLTYVKIHHPTWPESAAAHQGGSASDLTKQMLAQWNSVIQELRLSLKHPDFQQPFQPYGNAFQPRDLAEIPAFDLPAGSPDWMRGSDWAQRTGSTASDKRYTISITVPPAGRE